MSNATPDIASLTDAERAASTRILTGDVARFDGAGKPRLRAEVLRAVALQSPAPVCGLRVFGAHIEGDLDLSCTSLPAVILENCDIPGCIDLSNARLGALSLQDSRFFHLFARGAAIDGPFDFSAAAPFEQQAWIDASKASIRGGVTARGAKLRTPPKRPKSEIPARSHIYALRLSETEIRGNLWLADGFVAEGGICLDEAHVHGTCSIVEHSSLTPAEDDLRHPGDALHAYSLRVGGMMALNFSFRAQGRIFILNSKFSSRFNIDGRLNGARPGYDFRGRAMSTNAAMMMEHCEIGTSFNLTDTAVDCGISLNDNVFGDGVTLARTKISNPSPNGASAALTIERARIGRDLVFGPGFSAAGRVSLARSEIAGDLDLTGVQIDNATADDSAVALDARRLRVGGELRPQDLGRGGGLDIKGKIDFTGSTI